MGSRQRILLVDDDRDILSSFRELLTIHGYDVDTARTGREATDKSVAKVYNLAVIDMKLPDMEGIELLARFHRNYPRPKKIMITGYPTMENAISSVNLQADAYIIKPVNPEEFLRLVEEKLREQTEEDEITEEKMKNWEESQQRKSKDDPPFTR